MFLGSIHLATAKKGWFEWESEAVIVPWATQLSSSGRAQGEGFHISFKSSIFFPSLYQESSNRPGRFFIPHMCVRFCVFFGYVYSCFGYPVPDHTILSRVICIISIRKGVIWVKDLKSALSSHWTACCIAQSLLPSPANFRLGLSHMTKYVTTNPTSPPPPCKWSRNFKEQNCHVWGHKSNPQVCTLFKQKEGFIKHIRNR